MVEYKRDPEIEIQMESKNVGWSEGKDLFFFPIVLRSYCHGLPSYMMRNPWDREKGLANTYRSRGQRRQVKERALSLSEVPDYLSRSMDLHPELWKGCFRWVVRAEAKASVNIFYSYILYHIVVARSVQSLLPVEVSNFLRLCHSVDCFMKHYWEGPASALLSEERVRKSLRLKNFRCPGPSLIE